MRMKHGGHALADAVTTGEQSACLMTSHAELLAVSEGGIPIEAAAPT